MKFLSIYKTVNIYIIASNSFHDELFNDNKEMETEEGPDVYVVGIKRRSRKRLNNVAAIEGLIATAQKKLKKAMEVKEKVRSETYNKRRAKILELLTSEEYNPKASSACAFEAKLLNPSTQRCLSSIHPVTQDIQPAVLQFVFHSSLTKGR